MGLVAARSQHSYELGSVWSFICVCCEMELLCYDVLVGGEVSQVKTKPFHSILLLVSEPGQRVLETATNETQLFHAVVRAGGLYLIEGVGDCNE